MVWFKVVPHAGLLVVPVGVLALIVLGTAIGLIITPIGMLYQDVGRALAIVTQVWFFLTPVIYPVPKGSIAATLIEMNPVTPLLTSTREWLIHGFAPAPVSFFVVSVFSLVLLFIAWILYRISLPHLISRMSA